MAVSGHSRRKQRQFADGDVKVDVCEAGPGRGRTRSGGVAGWQTASRDHMSPSLNSLRGVIWGIIKRDYYTGY